MRHKSPISGIASFEDKYIATAGYDNKVILWDVKSHTPLSVGNHDHLVNYCEFSRDGKYLVTASSDYTARLWSVPSLQLLSVLSEHDDDVENISIHPFKELIATASRDHMVRIFTFDGTCVGKYSGHSNAVISVNWLEDGKQLISSSDDGTIRLWDIATSKEIEKLIDGSVQTDTLAIASSRNIFAGDDLGVLHVFEKNRKYAIKAHKAGIKKIIYSQKHHKCLTVSYDRTARLWGYSIHNELKLEQEFMLPPIVWARTSCFLGEDNIAFGTFGDSYATYNYRSNQWELSKVHPTFGINAVLCENADLWTIGDAGEFKLNNSTINKVPSLCNFLIKVRSRVYCGGQTGELFDASSGEVLYRHKSPLNCGTHCKDVLIVGSYTGEAIFFKEDSSGILSLLRTVKLHDNAIKGLALAEDILFSVCATGAIAWYNVNQSQLVHSILDAHHAIANGCIALEDKQFATVSRDLYLRVWNSDNFSLVEKISTPHKHSIKCISSDISKRYIATGSYRGDVAIFDRKNLTWQMIKVSVAGISALSFDAVNNAFVAASYDGEIYNLQVV